METKVVSTGTGPGFSGMDQARPDPAWMSYSSTAVLITTFIAFSSVLLGAFATDMLALHEIWTFVFAIVVLIVEMSVFVSVIHSFRRRHSSGRKAPPAEPPFKRAA